MPPTTSQRNTSQRRAIIKALESAPGPLTPQEILERAGQDHKRLGLATVYRNLNTLSDHGEIVAVHLPNDITRYEVSGLAHHHHFRCEACAKVFELSERCPVAVLEGVTLPGGFKVQGHELTLYGICPDCH
jgi:Fur family transcriptional regulator, ferric uptake regulator